MTIQRTPGVSNDLRPEEWTHLIEMLTGMLRARFVDISHEDVEDAIQDAICRVLQTNSIRSLKGLLRKVAMNSACDQLRRLQCERSKLGRRVPLEVSDRAVDPSEQEKNEALQDASLITFAELPAYDRWIISRKATGAKFTEIAAGLGVPEYRVRRLYHRAIRLAREALEARIDK